MAELTRPGEMVSFAVHTDILNRPVREVDRGRHREMWLMVGAVAVLVVAMLITVWQESEGRRLGFDVQRLQNERAAEEAANYHLRVELETLRSLKRIEALATQKLHLVAPATGEAVVIERVKPGPQPAKSLVARRRP